MANLLASYLRSLPTMKDMILNIISAYDIYCELTSAELTVGGSKLIKSPLRDDGTPTFGLFMHHTEDIVMFKDFAYESGDVFKFIKLFARYQDGIILNSLYGTAIYLGNKLGIDIIKNGQVNDHVESVIKRREFNAQTARDIKFISRLYTKFDKEYWEQYCVPETVLKYYDVRSIKKLLDEEGRILKEFSNNTVCFAYVIYNKVKLYQPLEAVEFKWRNTCPAWYLQGWKQRRGKKKLIITKSMKDIMVFFVILGKKYDIIAPHSENYIFPDKVVDKINSLYDEVIVIFDFDRAGVNGANRLKRLYGWKAKFIDTRRVLINGKYKVIDKDISDLVVNKGLKQAKIQCKKMNL